MKSIEKLLLGWVLSTLIVGAAALVGGSYWLYREELGEVFDENLKEVALATAYDYAADTGQPRAIAVFKKKPGPQPISSSRRRPGPARRSKISSRSVWASSNQC